MKLNVKSETQEESLFLVPDDRIFPNSTQLNIKAKPSIKYKRYVRIKKIKFNSVVELNDLFGPSWYITHVGSDIGVHIGAIHFLLIKEVLCEYKTKLDLRDPTIIEKTQNPNFIKLNSNVNETLNKLISKCSSIYFKQAFIINWTHISYSYLNVHHNGWSINMQNI